jgi:hypothetical protein
MEEGRNKDLDAISAAKIDIRSVIKDAIEEFTKNQTAKAEPAYKNELMEERKRREQLERRVNELISENARSRQVAEEAERNAAIRAELQRLGVAKVDLAFRAIKEDIRRSEDGHLVAAGEHGPVGLREYLTQFVNDNPEFLPARNLGGSGVTASPSSGPAVGPAADIDKIKPGMTAEELEQIRQEVARIASQSLSGR